MGGHLALTIIFSLTEVLGKFASSTRIWKKTRMIQPEQLDKVLAIF